jgi:thiol-disulfide isomerase/thioredoxin
VVRRVRVAAMIMIAVGFIAGCAGSGGARPAAALPAAAGSGPLQFTAKTVSGEAFSGQSLAGKPAVLWFWAPWCPICQGEAPSVARVAHANPTVTFVGVAAEDALPAMRDFVARYQLDFFTNLSDVDASVWRHFGVTAQPAFAFVAANGGVTVVKSALAEPDLSQHVRALIAT